MEKTERDYTVTVGKVTAQYSEKQNNYVAPKELTVTITLNEYRELVYADARHKQTLDEQRASYDKMINERDEKIRQLEAYNEQLRNDRGDGQ